MLRHQTTLATRHRAGTVTTASSVSQYGITWTFDQAYPVGQFVNGDWWVIGPVTVTNVDPAPTTRLVGEDDAQLSGQVGLRVDNTRRHGSMVPTTIGVNKGYDSRSLAYNAALSISFPYALPVNRSMVSSISSVAPAGSESNWSAAPGKELADGAMPRVMQTAAVLTCLASTPPADAFRPPYWGTSKPIFRAGSVRWDRLLNLTPTTGSGTHATPSIATYARYVQRVWLDDMGAHWEEQWMLPYQNEPAYGRANAAVMGTCGLLANCNYSQAQKQPLVYGMIQIGIDLAGFLKADVSFRAAGGHGSGRKFPVHFAGLMLDDDPYFTFAANRTGVQIGHIEKNDPQSRQGLWQEDTDTYWGQTYYHAPACFQMCAYTATTQPFQEKLPPYSGADSQSYGYRNCCTVSAWVGQALTTLLMGAKAKWNHDSYFQVVDDWMVTPDPYAAYRAGNARPITSPYETWAWNPWTTDMWRAYRFTQVPAQANGADNLKWDVNTETWISNPPP